MRLDDFSVMAGSPRMAAEPEPHQDFVGEVTRVFHTEVMRALLGRSAESPDEVRRAIAALKKKLESLQDVIGEEAETSATDGGGARLAPTSQGSSSANGNAKSFAQLGRNQRSRLRELMLLEFLDAESRAFSLDELTSSLARAGVADTESAVVSQLHRMKNSGCIQQPHNGFYEITKDGLSHLRKLRASIGPLLR